MAGTTPMPVSSAPAAANSGVGLTTTPAARAFVGHVSEAAKLAMSQSRPWGELADRNSFAKPENFSDALTRIRKNASYFRINYIIVLLLFVGLSLVTHVASLITLGVVVAAWCYLYMVRRDPLVIWGRTFNEKEILVLMTVLTILGFLLTGVASLLITALLIGSAVIAIHGAFRVPDDLFLDDQESSGGLFSFLGPSGPQPPTAVSHV